MLVLNTTKIFPLLSSSKFNFLLRKKKKKKKVCVIQTLWNILKKQRLFDLDLYATQHSSLRTTGRYADRRVTFAPKFVIYLMYSQLSSVFAITFCLVPSFLDSQVIWRAQIKVHKNSYLSSESFQKCSIHKGKNRASKLFIFYSFDNLTVKELWNWKLKFG